MSSKNDMRTQIVARLSGALSPIRDSEELAEALGAGEQRSVACGEEPLSVEEIVGMLSPRDYLFTNPWQVADLLAWRTEFPTHPVAIH